MVTLQSLQVFRAMQNYQTTSSWYTQTRNSKSSQELNKPYSFQLSAYKSSLFSDKVAGSLARIITSGNQLHATAESYRSTGTAGMNNRVVTSSDSNSVKATASNGTDLNSVEVSVESIAVAQTNTGASFNAASPTSLQTGTQKFAITTGNTTTNVSFFANSTDTHEMTLDKMKMAINSSESGLVASVVKDPVTTNLHLQLQSKGTGISNAFVIVDVNGNAVSSTGVHSVNVAASNAAYRVNGGSLQSSDSNLIKLNNGQITATLLKPTSESVTLTSKPDSDAISKQTKQLVKDYNALMNLISNESTYLNPSVKRNLQNALKANDLDNLGISKRADGTLVLDESKLNNRINSQFEQVARSINGADGIASSLSKVTDRLQSSPAEALLNTNNREYKQYNNYQSSLQFYSQFPTTGLLMNNFF